jgi:hypothetical protein
MMVRSRGGGEGVKPNFGQSVAIFTVKVVEMSKFLLSTSRDTKHHCSIFLDFPFFLPSENY